MPIKTTLPRIVFAKATTAIGGDLGMIVQLVAGEPWDASDPVVAAHPELFADTPFIRVKTSAGWVAFDEL